MLIQFLLIDRLEPGPVAYSAVMDGMFPKDTADRQDSAAITRHNIIGYYP